MTNDISRRLFLKLTGAAGATIALPAVPAIAEPQEMAPVFEYNAGNGWIALGDVFEADMHVFVDLIWQGDGVPPLKGLGETKLTVEYYWRRDDPFYNLERRDRFAARIYFPEHKYHMACDEMMPMEHTMSSSGRNTATLISRRFPTFTAV